jgi:hypothetical protein
MELFSAHKQWATRPEDEHFTSLRGLYDATKRYADQAVERKDITLGSLSAVATDGEVQLVRAGGIPARLSNWAFGQVAKVAKAPADFLRELPAEKTADLLNLRLAQRARDAVVNILFHQNGSLLVRAFTSDLYSRIWNYEVVDRLLEYESNGWVPARPTMQAFIDRGTDAKGQPIEQSTALYASDHDMFAFITHPDRIIKEEGNPAGLLRGLIAINSEVGASKIKLIRFLYREMCGNHIIWGAEDVTEMSARHVGTVRDSFGVWAAEVKRYLDSSPNEDEAKVRDAKRKMIAGTKQDVLDALFGKRTLQLSRKLLTAGYDAVIPEQDGSPNSYWGMAQGLTRASQSIPFADERTKVDIAAGKVLALAF